MGEAERQQRATELLMRIYEDGVALSIRKPTESDIAYAQKERGWSKERSEGLKYYAKEWGGRAGAGDEGSGETLAEALEALLQAGVERLKREANHHENLSTVQQLKAQELREIVSKICSMSRQGL